jgi:hypothetical protein
LRVTIAVWRGRCRCSIFTANESGVYECGTAYRGGESGRRLGYCRYWPYQKDRFDEGWPCQKERNAIFASSSGTGERSPENRSPVLSPSERS